MYRALLSHGACRCSKKAGEGTADKDRQNLGLRVHDRDRYGAKGNAGRGCEAMSSSNREKCCEGQVLCTSSSTQTGLQTVSIDKNSAITDANETQDRELVEAAGQPPIVGDSCESQHLRPDKHGTSGGSLTGSPRPGKVKPYWDPLLDALSDGTTGSVLAQASRRVFCLLDGQVLWWIRRWVVQNPPATCTQDNATFFISSNATVDECNARFDTEDILKTRSIFHRYLKAQLRFESDIFS